MKVLGLALAAAGVVWGSVAFNMPTSVEVSGISGLYQRGEVFNLDLAERRRTHLYIAGALFVSGVLLTGIGALRHRPAKALENSRQCPFCAEEVRTEAIICKHCGKDLPKVAAGTEAVAEETLIEAVERGSWASVSRLLQQGANPNQPDAKGRTALAVAQGRGDKQIEALLVSKGARST